MFRASSCPSAVATTTAVAASGLTSELTYIYIYIYIYIYMYIYILLFFPIRGTCPTHFTSLICSTKRYFLRRTNHEAPLYAVFFSLLQTTCLGCGTSHAIAMEEHCRYKICVRLLRGCRSLLSHIEHCKEFALGRTRVLTYLGSTTD